MVELLSFLLEILGDLLFQLAGEAILDLALRFFRSPDFDSAAVAGIYLVLGAFAGGFSLLIFPHPLVRPSRLHGMSLLVTPTLTGAIMSLLGSLLRQKGKRVVQIESFWCAFAFGFGVALVRLLFAA